MDAIILVNKPAGMTSFDAVAKCRKIFHERKIGHSGTLDPQATGLMLIVMGKYTKLLPYCVKDHKHYVATFKLGEAYDTEDIWGTLIETKQPTSHTQEELDEVCKKFTGDIMQVPPMYSALKKDGKKLYEYAREGIEVERKARPATVSSLSVIDNKDGTYTMDAVVSSGTYIRTLIKDFCNELNELGSMTSLVRLGIEHLSLEDANTLEDLENNPKFLTPKEVLNPEYPLVELMNYQRIIHGKIMKLDNHKEPIVIFTHEDLVLAAYKLQDDGVYHSLRGLF